MSTKKLIDALDLLDDLEVIDEAISEMHIKLSQLTGLREMVANRRDVAVEMASDESDGNLTRRSVS